MFIRTEVLWIQNAVNLTYFKKYFIIFFNWDRKKTSKSNIMKLSIYLYFVINYKTFLKKSELKPNTATKKWAQKCEHRVFRYYNGFSTRIHNSNSFQQLNVFGKSLSIVFRVIKIKYQTFHIVVELKNK